MKNSNLLIDLDWVAGKGDTEKQIMNNTVDYILFLEQREDRLHALEDRLNKVLEADVAPDKNGFIKQFKEFIYEDKN